MFLESVGKGIFSKIRPLFFYGALLVPPILALAFLSSEFSQFEDFSELYARTKKKAALAFEKKNRKEALIYRYQDAPPFFLDQKAEAMVFCQKEVAAIQKLLRHPAVANKKALQDRLAVLSKEANCLSFSEGESASNDQFVETEEKQKRPIQVDEEGLKHLLSWIEDIAIDAYPLTEPHRPQFLVLDFRMKKKRSPVQTEVFEVDMELLKREFF